MVPTGSCDHILTHFGANALGKTQRPEAPTPTSVSLISPLPQSWLFSGRPVIISSRNVSHVLLQLPGKLLPLHLLGYSSAPFKRQLVSILQGSLPSHHAPRVQIHFPCHMFSWNPEHLSLLQLYHLVLELLD